MAVRAPGARWICDQGEAQVTFAAVAEAEGLNPASQTTGESTASSCTRASLRFFSGRSKDRKVEERLMGSRRATTLGNFESSLAIADLSTKISRLSDLSIFL
jgi:hypothetical protein